jgi:DNA-binding MurR/RpiR family transcriptional regulator
MALRGARRLSVPGAVYGKGIEVSEFYSDFLSLLRPDEVAMIVSGSRLRIKRVVHETAAQITSKGAKVISITDSNDPELISRSEIAILVPPQSEIGGSMLALSLLELLATQWARKQSTLGSRQ